MAGNTEETVRAPEPVREEAQELAAPVVSVTLMEDRARVVRRTDLELSAGITTFRITGVAPVLADKTLSATIAPEAAAQCLDLTIKREKLVDDKERPERIRELRSKIRDLERDLKVLAEERQRLDLKLRDVRQTQSDVLLDVTEDSSWNRTAPENWGTALDTLRTRERELKNATVDSDLRVEELQETLSTLREELQQAKTPAARFAAVVTGTLKAATAARIELGIEYVVPNACWRPAHTARLLEEGDARVEFSCAGCIWQNTGEDWNDVQLQFSTQRSKAGMEPPLLSTDRLHARPKRKQVLVEQREETVHTSGLGSDEDTTDALPGIDDGGSAVNIAAPSRATVVSDGRPHRVNLFSFETEAKVDLVCVPELQRAVIRKTTLTNAGAVPILAGPVDLIRNGGPTGRTDVLYIAPGERFELGWGAEGAVTVNRTREVNARKDKLLSSWLEHVVEVNVALSNLGNESVELTLTERIPVSEIDRVQIKLDGKRTTGDVSPDDQGFVRWQVTLAPAERRATDLTYVLRHRGDVVGIVAFL